jgi:hypothetical protein
VVFSQQFPGGCGQASALKRNSDDVAPENGDKIGNRWQ